jgi:hypothetical protein
MGFFDFLGGVAKKMFFGICGGIAIILGILIVACQSFCPKIVTVFMSAFKSTGQVLAGESDNGDQNQSSRIL